MDNEQLENESSSLGQRVTLDENQWYNPYYGTIDKRAPITETAGIYEQAAKKGLAPDKGTGLYFDSCMEQYCQDIPPDVRQAYAKMDTEAHEQSPEPPVLEERDPVENPRIVTLEEKAIAHHSYKQVLALAGVAVRNQETMFDEIEEEIRELRTYTAHLRDVAKNLEEKVKFLKKLAVLE